MPNPFIPMFLSTIAGLVRQISLIPHCSKPTELFHLKRPIMDLKVEYYIKNTLKALFKITFTLFRGVQFDSKY